MPWIDVTERLPELDREVPVFGAHTPEGFGYPLAYRRLLFGSEQWCSREWRGTVGITYWWEE